MPLRFPEPHIPPSAPGPACGGSRASLFGVVSPFPPASHSAWPGLPSPPPLQVAPQPLWFSDTVANLRKLKELPYHLLHSGRLEELKQEVLGKPWAGLDHPLCSPFQESGKSEGQKSMSLASLRHWVSPGVALGNVWRYFGVQDSGRACYWHEC